MDNFINSLAGKHVVLSGCGGGSDVLGSSVIYAQIKETARKVVFFNFSFSKTELLDATCVPISPNCWRVDPCNVALEEDVEEKVYFPEARMANVTGMAIYAFSHEATIQQVTDGYKVALKQEFVSYSCWKKRGADVLVLCDGGCDVLLTGLESGLATPSEDMTHLKAILPLNIPQKYIAVLGANVDCAHGVVPEELDHRLSDLEDSGTMLCSAPIAVDDLAGRYFEDLVLRCAPTSSIVQSLVLAAMQGYRGLYTPVHLRRRIMCSTVSLSDQTRSLYVFHLDRVARDILYLDRLHPSFDHVKVSCAIREFRSEVLG
ncbi:unnamed protein product [Durusdinium trenchii]|uniref:DUF1152 domain-containing protein n=2 Tax=Durusdinium trenchii TaxID=1381693 RepID=A0ABP0PHR7_9DINO